MKVNIGCPKKSYFAKKLTEVHHRKGLRGYSRNIYKYIFTKGWIPIMRALSNLRVRGPSLAPLPPFTLLQPSIQLGFRSRKSGLRSSQLARRTDIQTDVPTERRRDRCTDRRTIGAVPPSIRPSVWLSTLPSVQLSICLSVHHKVGINAK